MTKTSVFMDDLKKEADYRKVFRLNLKALRILTGVGQYDLCDRFDIKQQTVSQWESPAKVRKMPNLAGIHKIAALLGVKPWTLLIPEYYYRNIDPKALEQCRKGNVSDALVAAIERSAAASRKLYG